MTLPTGEQLVAEAGARFAVDSVDGGATRVRVYAGTVQVFNGATARTVRAGESWTTGAVIELADPERTDWLREADQARARGDLADAARAYEKAAAHLRGGDAATAGYQAAYLLAHRLHDPAAALRVLDATRADRAGAPLEERALVLRITVLDRLGADAAPAVARYLARFPDGDWAETLRAR
jgi:hypothetical protein